MRGFGIRLGRIRACVEGARVEEPMAGLTEDEGEKKMRVLIVDDDRILLDTFTVLLGRFGYTLETAESFEAAQDLLDRRHFDVVVSDLNLEESRDGLDVLELAARRLPGVRRILLTGDGLCETEGTGLEVILSKPVTGKMLSAAIQGDR